jgi:cysteinyl-tRNA synthetase
MYTCGPTVYNPAHLGNFRTFLFEDLLRRTIRLRGWGVMQVMNLTDVDDKIITRATERGLTITQVTVPPTEAFHRDRAFLRIESAEVYPKATEHIPEMIAMVQRLEEKGLAYKAEDGSVYFAIARFPEYGRLSRLDTREIRAGARVAADDYNKEDVRDFALWKAAKPEDEKAGAAWDSPWGRGRPGWHLECSAMAKRYLGDTLDLHAGGVDLIFPHHEDEIAQSEGANGVTFARCWCHGEFLLTEGAKMAKRVGNVANVEDLRTRGIPAAAARHVQRALSQAAEPDRRGAGGEPGGGAPGGGVRVAAGSGRGGNAGDGESGGRAREERERGAVRGPERAGGARRALQVPEPGERGAGCRGD